MWPALASMGRTRSSQSASAPKGFPDRLTTGVPSSTEPMVGMPGFMRIFQNRRCAPHRARASCMMSFLPTETPPVVMMRSACPQASTNRFAITSGRSGTRSRTVISTSNSRSRAARKYRLLS